MAEAIDIENMSLMKKRMIKTLRNKITHALLPPTEQEDQRERENQQRVINDTPILTIPRITDAPTIMQSQNPTEKRTLKITPRIHQCVTRNNTPKGLPLITDKTTS